MGCVDTVGLYQLIKNLIDITALSRKSATDPVAWLFPAFFVCDSHQALQ